MTESIGVAQPVTYTELERRRIATHEAGHATVAWLVGQGRKLDVLSIVKRRNSLGLLAHSDTEERFVRSSSEISALIEIAFGGLVAEALFFGNTSSGVASDLLAATDAACQMIGSFGMGDTPIYRHRRSSCPATRTSRRRFSPLAAAAMPAEAC